MFESTIAVMEEAVAELQVPVDAEALARCFAVLDRFTAKVTCGVVDFDRAEGWRDVGATSMAAWLRSQVGRSQQEAASFSKTAHRLADLPATRMAWLAGDLTTAQVQTIVANLNDETAPLFAFAEEEILPVLRDLPVGDVSTWMQQWAQAARDSLQDPDDPGPELPERSLHLSRTMDGRRELSGSLDPEGGALAERALRLAQTKDVDGEPERTPATRRADALADICRFFLDHQQSRKGGRHRPHLNVMLDYDDLVRQATERRANRPGTAGGGWLLDGTVLDAATVQRLACDAGVHRVVTRGGSTILDYGRTVRTAPANLFAALAARDGHCRFPGCDRPPEWCEAHHLHHWAAGGDTKLEEMVLGCSRHHHLLHQPGWDGKLLPDGTFVVTTPDGRTLESKPQGRPPDIFDRRGP